MLNHPFSHPGMPDHVERLAQYWGEVFGGPPVYSSRCGGQSAMLTIHAGQQASADLGQRFLACFLAAADDAGLPEDPELREVLRKYMAWAVTQVLSYSPQGVEVAIGLPVPRWTWDSEEPAPQPVS